MANPVKMLPRQALIEKELKEQEAKTQFVGESVKFGKEVNRRLTEEGISIYEQIGILRKALVSMGCTDPEFVAFNAKVEQIKEEVRAEQNEHHMGD